MDHRLIFRRKAYDLNGLDTFFSLFPTELLVFACISCCFLSQCFIVLSYRISDLPITKIRVIQSRHNSYVPIEHFYCLSLKAIEFNGVDATGFLRNIVVLLYFFIIIDTLKSYSKKRFYCC